MGLDQNQQQYHYSNALNLGTKRATFTIHFPAAVGDRFKWSVSSTRVDSFVIEDDQYRWRGRASQSVAGVAPRLRSCGASLFADASAWCTHEFMFDMCDYCVRGYFAWLSEQEGRTKREKESYTTKVRGREGKREAKNSAREQLPENHNLRYIATINKYKRALAMRASFLLSAFVSLLSLPGFSQY